MSEGFTVEFCQCQTRQILRIRVYMLSYFQMAERLHVIKVECSCGQELAKYGKEGKGRLIKMYLDMILDDRAGVFSEEFETGRTISCPSCGERVATIQMVHGRPAAKMNQGVIKQTKT